MRLVLGTGFVALLVIAGAIAFTLGNNPHEGGATTEGFDVALVADEDVDPEPLAVEEVFSESSPSWQDDTAYERVRHEEADDCTSAAHEGFAAALEEHECRQILRASYLAEGEGTAVTLGVATFPTAEHARSAHEAQDIDSAQWFTGLAPGEDAQEQGSGQGEGYASTALWGRYLVFSLASTAGEDEEAEPDVEYLEEVSGRFLEVALAPLGARAAE